MSWLGRTAPNEMKTSKAIASAAPIAQVIRTTSSVSMPEMRASSGLSEVARIALPCRVERTIHVSASS